MTWHIIYLFEKRNNEIIYKKHNGYTYLAAIWEFEST